jgi:hypothetical protein
MTFTPNVFPTLARQPRMWPCSIGNGDASNWKQDVVAQGNGTKVISASVTSNDTSTRVIQMAIGRSGSVTCTSASPGVFTWTGNTLSIGDQIVLGGTAVPTGLTAGTTYYVATTGFVAGSTFELAASAGGTAINSTSTGTAVTATVIRPIATVSAATNSGLDGATTTQNFFNNTLNPLPTDQDGQPYLFLESGDSLYFGCTSTVTANKMMSVQAMAADF